MQHAPSAVEIRVRLDMRDPTKWPVLVMMPPHFPHPFAVGAIYYPLHNPSLQLDVVVSLDVVRVIYEAHAEAIGG